MAAIDSVSTLRRANGRLVGIGVHNLIAGVAGYRIVVTSLYAMSNQLAGAIGSVSEVVVQDSAGNAVANFFDGGMPIVLPYAEFGWFEVPSGLGLAIQVTANIVFTGGVSYRYVPDHQAW